MTITSGSIPAALPGGKSSISGARLLTEGVPSRNDSSHAFKNSTNCAFQDPQNCLAQRPQHYSGFTED